MEYNELLNKIQDRMKNISLSTFGTPQRYEKDDTGILLNKIGLEVQRQGGN